MRVALTTDWMDTFGGGERVLYELHRMFPDAPVFTTVHRPDALPPFMQRMDVRTSFIQRLPVVRRSHMAFLPLMPAAFESFDLSGYDLVITTSSACAKGVLTPERTVNVCYCHTPCRYIWDLYEEYTRGHPARPLIAPVARWLRGWDRRSSDRVTHFVANSNEVAGRIRRHYGRGSEVIPPPVDVGRIVPTGLDPEDFYLVVSRLVPYKRVDLAVAAATRLGRRLVVVGRGPELKRLRGLAGPTVEFRGALPDAEVAELYGRCRALLFPGLEDFGIVPVEAQAAGRPVLAYGRGGALDTVVNGETGLFFDAQSVDTLAEAMLRFEATAWDPAACRRNAERFDAAHFRRRMRRVIAEQLAGASGPRRERVCPHPAAAAPPPAAAVGPGVGG
jgi:glycosyltransferase involved in cell wall biosynthesis